MPVKWKRNVTKDSFYHRREKREKIKKYALDVFTVYYKRDILFYIILYNFNVQSNVEYIEKYIRILEMYNTVYQVTQIEHDVTNVLSSDMFSSA